MLGPGSGFCWIWTILTSLWQICIDANPREPAAASASLPTKRSLSREAEGERQKKCTQMSFIEYRFTLTSLGELRERMLNVNMNKWAEKRAANYHISTGTKGATLAGPFLKGSWRSWARCESWEVQVLVSMSHVACSKAARQQQGMSCRQAGNNLRNRNRRRGLSGGFSGHFKRETQHWRTTMPPGQDFGIG